MTLEGTRVFRVSQSLVATTEDALRKAGSSGYECFVLWTGNMEGDTFDVQHVYVPAQRSFRSTEGLHVRVDAEQLHGMNMWLYQNRQTLGIQVHTHPGEAYHSVTDDTYPIVTTLGGLSLVVPDFAQHGVLCTGTVLYRLHRDGWRIVGLDRAKRLLEVVA